MKEIAGNLKRDMRDLLGESANLVTGFFKRGIGTVRAAADKWKAFAGDISAAVGELMKPPFLDGGPEAPIPSMDEAAEPVVTVVEGIDQHFPIGAQMPLNKANDYVRQIDKAYIQKEFTPQRIKVRIDYTRNGQTDRYFLPLEIGAGGSLLEQMERHLSSYRASPERISALFQQVPAEYRQQLEAEFTPFIQESLNELSQGTLHYFRQHCGITEMEQQLEGQASVLPEKEQAAFLQSARNTIHGLRCAANRTPRPQREQARADKAADQPRQSVKVKLRQVKQGQNGHRKPAKARHTPQR